VKKRKKKGERRKKKGVEEEKKMSPFNLNPPLRLMAWCRASVSPFGPPHGVAPDFWLTDRACL